jgi:hypothetical protein
MPSPSCWGLAKQPLGWGDRQKVGHPVSVFEGGLAIISDDPVQGTFSEQHILQLDRNVPLSWTAIGSAERPPFIA